VVQQTTRERLAPDFGRAESNMRHGHVDLVVPRFELRPLLGRLLGLLAGGNGAELALEQPAETPASAVTRLVTRLRGLRHGRTSSNGAAHPEPDAWGGE
jgi:hypothetical protein